MFIGSGIPDVVQGNAEQPSLLCALENAFRKWPREHIGKQRENIKMHVEPHNLGGFQL